VLLIDLSRLPAIALAAMMICAAAVRPAGAVTCAPASPCGDVDGSGSLGAPDALRLLRVAVSVPLGTNCPCSAGICGADGVCGDVDSSGTVTASDALRTLRAAVGQSVAMQCSCSDGAGDETSVLYGATFFSGERPALGDVSYTSKTEGPLVGFNCYEGWVHLKVAEGTPEATVEEAVGEAGASVLAKTPQLGWYLLETGAGDEDAVLVELYENDWATDGNCVSPAVAGNGTSLDWNSGPEVSHPCLRYHGSLVTSIANRRNPAFSLESVESIAGNSNDLAALVGRKLEVVPEGSRQVLNLSLNFDLKPNETIAGKVTAGCDLACTKRRIGFQQFIFLRAFFEAMEYQWLKDPEVADRSLIVLIAGNTGVPLDAQLAGLRTSFPHAFERIAVVGGTEDDGSVEPGHFNYLDDDSSGNMMYARGEKVAVSSPETGEIECSGTSYAGPEVASVLEEVWKRAPHLTAAQILGGVRKALDQLGTSILPQDEDGRTTEDFLDLVVAAATGTTTTTTTTTTTSSTTTTTLGGCWCCCFWIPEFPFGWDCGEAQAPVDGGLCSYSAPGSGECGNGYCESQSE
jgi:hypothetical protein